MFGMDKRGEENAQVANTKKKIYIGGMGERHLLNRSSCYVLLPLTTNTNPPHPHTPKPSIKVRLINITSSQYLKLLISEINLSTVLEINIMLIYCPTFSLSYYILVGKL